MAPITPVTGADNVVHFAFDCVCPYAFIASERIDDIARFTGAHIEWKPVLLGGLYDLTNAPQGKDGSAMSAPMAEVKKKTLSADFQRDCLRYQIPLKFHPNHPLRSVDAGRLLCAFPSAYRSQLAHILFRAYWYDSANINSRPTLLRLARSLRLTSIASTAHNGPFSLDPVLPFKLDESLFEDPTWADNLRSNTQEAFGRGAFGVPSFWVEKTQRLYFGQDRLHLLEAALISIKLSKPISAIRQLERLHPRCLRTPPEDRIRRLKFWFDFSSPWAYLAWSQLERLQRDSGPGLKIEMKPFLLGALFRTIGTPMLPSVALIPVKREYATQDLKDWVEWWRAVNAQEYPPIEGPEFVYPEEFPIRSVTALRVALLEPKTIPAIYKAAWGLNQKISEEKVLAQVLTEAGFNGIKLLSDATTGTKAAGVKESLKANTDEAIKLGICGAPSFQIGSTILWGGDKLNVVQDLILGWKPEVSKLKATVSAFPHYDYRL